MSGPRPAAGSGEPPAARPQAVEDAVRLARSLFLDAADAHGCAEATFVALKVAYGLSDPLDASAAMALNGGLAYSGGMCGVLSGAALAVGMLARERIPDHQDAKRVARGLVAGLMDDFQLEHGSTSCRDLIGYDLRAPGGHAAFIASGTWRTRCADQIGFAVRRLAPLGDPEAWGSAVRALGVAPELGGGDVGPSGACVVAQ